MLTIRLQRVGRKHDPNYRVVLIESKRGPQSGAFREILGSYEPRKKNLALHEDRIKYWLGKGAQTSSTVHNILIRKKLKDGVTICVVPPAKIKEEAKKSEK